MGTAGSRRRDLQTIERLAVNLKATKRSLKSVQKKGGKFEMKRWDDPSATLGLPIRGNDAIRCTHPTPPLSKQQVFSFDARFFGLDESVRELASRNLSKVT